MKKIYVCIILVITIGAIGILYKRNYFIEKNPKKAKGYYYDIPTFVEEDSWGEEMFSNILIDKESKNLSVKVENKEIFINDSVINVSISNNIRGEGFYFYGIPIIEKFANDEWVRLSYKESDPNREQWCICALEDSPDVCFSTTLSVDTDNINDFTEGSYRMVVFLTDRNIYVPFEVIGEK